MLLRRVLGSEEPSLEEPRMVDTLPRRAVACSKGTTKVSEADFLRDPLVPRLEDCICITDMAL